MIIVIGFLSLILLGLLVHGIIRKLPLVNQQDDGKGWNYLGQLDGVWAMSQTHPRIFTAKCPSIRKWVRIEVTERIHELCHYGDTIIIKGSYWQYKISYCEMTSGGTHDDDAIVVWRKRR